MSLIRFLIDLSFLLKVSGLSCCLRTSGNEFQAIAALCVNDLRPSLVFGLDTSMLFKRFPKGITGRGIKTVTT